MAKNPRIVLEAGRWRVSKTGFNALTEDDPANMIFDSDWARTGIVHQAGTTDGSGYVFFDALPFVPHVLPFRLDGDLLFAGEHAVVAWEPSISGPISAYWPIDIRTDRFLMAVAADAPTPHVFPYIVFKVPVIGA